LVILFACFLLVSVTLQENELIDLLNLRNAQWSSPVTIKWIGNRSPSGVRNAISNVSTGIESFDTHDTVANENNRSTSINTSAVPENLLRRGDVVVNLTKLSWSMKARRGQFSVAPVNTHFLSDLKLLKIQLSLNYDRNSSCQHVDKAIMNGCYGLGSTMGNFNAIMVKNMLEGVVFDGVDGFECSWFQRDKTKLCSTMFGDCYFPAITRSQGNNQNGTCFDVEWFRQKYGSEALFSAHFSWMSSDVATETEPCIALHIRRGDACINNDRTCFDYDDYLKATKLFVNLYPELQRIVVVTDAHDFPLQTFQSLVKVVTYTSEVNRSKYNVDHLRNATIETWTPENRDLQNATSELLAEVSAASRCKAFVGTFSAGVSKWIFHNMLTRQGRVPLFYSIDGCLKNAFTGKEYSDRKCEARFLSDYNW
jgi:hypothetical protein